MGALGDESLELCRGGSGRGFERGGTLFLLGDGALEGAHSFGEAHSIVGEARSSGVCHLLIVRGCEVLLRREALGLEEGAEDGAHAQQPLMEAGRVTLGGGPRTRACVNLLAQPLDVRLEGLARR